MEAEGAPVEIEGEQERQVLQPPKKVFGVDLIKPARLAPEPRDHAKRHVHIFREHGQFGEARALAFIEQVQAHADGLGDGAGAVRGVSGVEGGQTFQSQPLVRARN